MIANTAPADTREVESFEEYTLYSLDRSLPALLGMMQKSKQVAGEWPGLPGLVGAVALSREIAALSCFQESLSDFVAEMEGQPADNWQKAYISLKAVMASMEDIMNMSDPDVALRLFDVDLPAALNAFALSIPELKQYIQEAYMGPDAAISANQEAETDGK